MTECGLSQRINLGTFLLTLHRSFLSRFFPFSEYSVLVSRDLHKEYYYLTLLVQRDFLTPFVIATTSNSKYPVYHNRKFVHASKLCSIFLVQTDGFRSNQVHLSTSGNTWNCLAYIHLLHIHVSCTLTLYTRKYRDINDSI